MAARLLDHVVMTDHRPDILDGVHAPACALAIWQRSLPEALTAALQPLPLDAINAIATTIPEYPSKGLIAALLVTAGYTAPAIPWLAADIIDLAGRHAHIHRAGANRLRLEVIETDACRKFHADHVTTRLICTYFGPGTQWIEAGDSMGIPSSLATGTVAIFKGHTLLPDPTILHRSPPIMASGDRRLLLVLDPVRPGSNDEA